MQENVKKELLVFQWLHEDMQQELRVVTISDWDDSENIGQSASPLLFKNA